MTDLRSGSGIEFAEMPAAPIVDLDGPMLIVPFVDPTILVSPTAPNSTRKPCLALNFPRKREAGQDVVCWWMDHHRSSLVVHLRSSHDYTCTIRRQAIEQVHPPDMVIPAGRSPKADKNP
jgi:hypothetical protein